MTRIESLQDLWLARAAAAEQQQNEDSQVSYHIRVGLGSCGIAAGAAETLEAINTFVADHNLSNIHVISTGCIGMCALEPLVQVQAPGQNVITYGKVHPYMARRIMQEHILNGMPVHEYVVENI